MNEITRTLIIVGIFLIVSGFIIQWVGKIPFIGKLPGDFLFKKNNVTFCFPLTTCILISVIVSFLFFLWKNK